MERVFWFAEGFPLGSNCFSYSHTSLCNSWTKQNFKQIRWGSVANWHFVSRSIVLLPEPETKIFLHGEDWVPIEITSPMHHSFFYYRKLTVLEASRDWTSWGSIMFGLSDVWANPNMFGLSDDILSQGGRLTFVSIAWYKAYIFG